MRHFLGFVAGLLLTPVLPVATWWALQYTTVALEGDPAVSGRALMALGVLVASGAVVGVLASTRWMSPLASLVMGVIYLAVTGAYVYSPDLVLQAVPASLPGTHVTELVGQGIVAMLGAALVLSSLTPRRWRREHRDDEEFHLAQMRPETPPEPAPGLAEGSGMVPVPQPGTGTVEESGRHAAPAVGTQLPDETAVHHAAQPTQVPSSFPDTPNAPYGSAGPHRY